MTIRASTNEFHSALAAREPSKDIPNDSNLYGWLVGSWEGDIIEYERDGSKHIGRAECHFGWVLEGRAIQDVWISPPQAARQGDLSKIRPVNRYGTTVRVYDPRIDAWHITWINPVAGVQLTQIGRRRGEDIVQEGRNPAGQLTRWTFSEISDTSFRWTGEMSADEGASWFLHLEFRLRRTGGSAASSL